MTLTSSCVRSRKCTYRQAGTYRLIVAMATAAVGDVNGRHDVTFYSNSIRGVSIKLN